MDPGKVGCPLQPLRADIDYAPSGPPPPTGVLGIKVWVSKGGGASRAEGATGPPLEHHVRRANRRPQEFEDRFNKRVIRSPEPLLSHERVQIPQTSSEAHVRMSPPEGNTICLWSVCTAGPGMWLDHIPPGSKASRRP